MKNFYILFIAIILFLIVYYGNKNFSNFDEKAKVNLETNEEMKPDKILEDRYISPISIEYLRSLKFESQKLKIERLVSVNASYSSYLASYTSEGEKVYAQLTIPKLPKPENGFPAIIFNHGYIPPKSYNTFANYSAYVDYLARNGFVVLKIDMRGHGNSEGQATGTYFSSTYLKDVISAKKALQEIDEVDSNRIGLWGHSMSGNLVLRTLLVDNELKAGVIWAGAVYSYKDFYNYRITDNSYSAIMQTQPTSLINPNRENSLEVVKFRNREVAPDFESDFWKSISLTENLKYLSSPIQLHHSINDEVVNVAYSRDLVKELEKNNKIFEYHEYPGGGHNITGVYFNQAMSKTLEFFRIHLK